MTNQLLSALGNELVEQKSYTFEVLRIIAKDASLSTPDREAIRSAADELEAQLRALLASQAEVFETRSRLIAVTDQLIEARKTIAEMVAIKPQIDAVSGIITATTGGHYRNA